MRHMSGQGGLNQTAGAPAQCRLVPGTPHPPGDAASPDEVIAGLRAANAQMGRCWRRKMRSSRACGHRWQFDDNPAEQAIRMSKLRIKVSGCMRSMTGAEIFCAIRSYLATAARHGIGALDALTRAATGSPWIPEIQVTA